LSITVERIFQLMKKENIPQKEMASLLNISESVLSDWKNPKRTTKPTVEQIDFIAGFFTTTTDYLLGRTDNPRMPKGVIRKPTAPKGQPVSKHEALMNQASEELADLPVGDLERILEMVRAYKRK